MLSTPGIADREALSAMNEAPLLQIQSLSVHYRAAHGFFDALRGVDLELSPGECLGVVGESGSGKTQLLLSILGLCGPGAAITGSIRYRGQLLSGLSDDALNAVRGRRIGIVFQDPMMALNPYLRIGVQITEVLRQHCDVSTQLARLRAIELLDTLHVPDAAQRMLQYPHELSGGMRQRVMIAIAMIAEPEILLADEPSTALDMTVQAQVIALLRELRMRCGTSIVLVTHDLGVTAQLADRVAVMHAGKIIEQAPVRDLFAHPQHAYTRALLQSLSPRATPAPRPATAAPLLSVRDLTIAYRGVHHGQASLPAVSGVSFELTQAETLGVVGESGSGKTSIARALLRLVQPQSGTVMFRGADLLQAQGTQLRELRRHLQLVFQDPLDSLDPRMPVGEIVCEPLQSFEPALSPAQRLERAVEALIAVGLSAEHVERYPHELSGGQAQRIGIARALICAPDLLICDEPLSALDVSIKSQIADLLKSLQRQRRLTMLFISHDLAAIRSVCDRVLVLYLGRVLEVASTQDLFNQPRHPYTRALIDSTPEPDPERRESLAASIAGEVPSTRAAPTGCVFRTRCPFAIERCALEVPQLRLVGHSSVACDRAEQITG